MKKLHKETSLQSDDPVVPACLFLLVLLQLRTASAAPAAAVASAVGDSLVGGAVRSATSAGVSTFLGSALPVGDSVGVRFGVARVRGREDGGL
ncbi:hypothetical protein INT45_005509 [Circinella minor]|uniref:Secreted protein n=1 Tax=Circinella minor TaxID=1195481 RepID=A0A8H7REQ9_9FUNG|nr:hypothetical protein INT45_005509 [Circinella minor]